MMDQKTRKLLEEKARKLSPEWLETGKRNPGERFFGLFTKKQMSIVLIIILFLAIITDAAIFYLLYLIK
jgi:hypothetical protein